ncbi:MAG: HPr(Ser) kinase/phosphatase [candidate division NC10 bacterium]|nr:HPr(Ser) kinase/phosphatase [candidate division NC10 bacterium]
MLHGVLVDVFGVGVLLLGESGTGKSECALDLVSRGHRLVADDVVEVVRQGEAIIIGRGSAQARHHMEVRGLGIINVRELFGVTAIRYRKRIELVIQLEPWRPDAEYDRLGIEEQTQVILGVAIPRLCVPVSAGRSIAILVEVAARNHLLKLMGVHAARSFLADLGKVGGGGKGEPPSFSREDIE